MSNPEFYWGFGFGLFIGVAIGLSMFLIRLFFERFEIKLKEGKE